MYKTILCICLFMFFLVIFSPLAIEPPPERDAFTFAILGDRTGGDPEGLSFLRRAIYELNQIKPDFVIHIGDMVQGYTRDLDRWLREYEEFASYMDKLTVPWYPTAGNHDVFTPIWDTNDRTFEELYKSYFGPLYYSFDYKNSHFIIMYTDEAMTSKPVISNTQIQWLKSDLEGTKKTNIFIFLHKPVWRYEDNNWEAIHQLLKGYPVRAVIAGHFHAYQKDVSRDGIQYYLMGVTGAEAFISEDELTGWINHYNLLKVDGDEFTMAIVKLGNVESDDYILTDDYNKIWTIGKLPPEKTGTLGWLWQPIASPVKGEIKIYANNPLDIELPVKVRLNPAEKLWSIAPPSHSFTVAPNSNFEAKFILSSPQAEPADILPPELEFEYIYPDSRGDEVPVIVRNRVFLRGTYDVHKASEPIKIDGLKNEPFWTQTAPLYNRSWVYSVYERHEEPPKVYLASDATYLYFYAEVMDEEYSHLKENKSGRILSDTIFFSAQPGGDRREIVIYPFQEDKIAFTGKVDKKGLLNPDNLVQLAGAEYNTKIDLQDNYYYCEGKIPLQALFGNEPVAGKEVSFNIGVIDNDLEAFTYLYSWAFDKDPQYWGMLKFKK